MAYERPMDGRLMKIKAHKARGGEHDLFMAHGEVLKSIKRQRLTHEREIVGLHV